jgi:hypothetical protein
MPSKRRVSQKKRVTRRREKKLSKKGGRRTRRLHKKGSGPGTQELTSVVDGLWKDIPTFADIIRAQSDEDIKERYSGQFRLVVIDPLVKAKKISQPDKERLRSLQITDKKSLWNAIEECISILESTYDTVKGDKSAPSIISMFKSSEHKDLQILGQKLLRLNAIMNDVTPMIEEHLRSEQSRHELEQDKITRAEFAKETQIPEEDYSTDRESMSSESGSD